MHVKRTQTSRGKSPNKTQIKYIYQIPNTAYNGIGYAEYNRPDLVNADPGRQEVILIPRKTATMPRDITSTTNI